jgi:hypothetical protein
MKDDRVSTHRFQVVLLNHLQNRRESFGANHALSGFSIESCKPKVAGFVPPANAGVRSVQCVAEIACVGIGMGKEDQAKLLEVICRSRSNDLQDPIEKVTIPIASFVNTINEPHRFGRRVALPISPPLGRDRCIGIRCAQARKTAPPGERGIRVLKPQCAVDVLCDGGFPEPRRTDNPGERFPENRFKTHHARRATEIEKSGFIDAFRIHLGEQARAQTGVHSANYTVVGFGNPVWLITNEMRKMPRTRANEGKSTTSFFEDDALQKLEED